METVVGPRRGKLTKLAAYWLFPGMVIAMSLGNQPFETAMVLGQIAWLANDLAAVLIVRSALRHKRWVFLLVTSVLAAKVLRIATGSGLAETSYIGLLNVLFCVSGLIVAFQRPTLVYRQVMVFLLLSLVAMVFQVTGAGAWTMMFTTHGEGNLTEPVSTLFVQAADLDYLLVQGRPAGLSYANVVLSLIILFGFALHFPRTRRAFWWGSALLCAVAVFSMAKIAFVGFVLTGVLVLWFGGRPQRMRMLRAGALFIVILGLYAVLFPGLFSTNLSGDSLGASFFFRANDIMAALNPDIPFGVVRAPYFEGTPYFSNLEEGEFVSGYASLIVSIYRNLIPIAGALTLGIGLFVVGFRRLKRRFPALTLRVVLVIAIIGLFPATHPIWAAPIYWFMAGLGSLPIVYWLRPRFIVQARQVS